MNEREIRMDERRGVTDHIGTQQFHEYAIYDHAIKSSSETPHCISHTQRISLFDELRDDASNDHDSQMHSHIRYIGSLLSQHDFLNDELDFLFEQRMLGNLRIHIEMVSNSEARNKERMR